MNGICNDYILQALNRFRGGKVLHYMLLTLPVIIKVVTLMGGLFAVGTSATCDDKNFLTYTRGFLYCTFGYSFLSAIVNLAKSAVPDSVMVLDPMVAYCVHGAHVLFYLITLCVMLTLFGGVWKYACPSIKNNAKRELHSRL